MTHATEFQNLPATKEDQSVEEESSSNENKVIVIDEMAIVSKINIANSQLNNCDDIAKCFTDMITNKTEDCDKFRVEFDRYDLKFIEKQIKIQRNRRTLSCAL